MFEAVMSEVKRYQCVLSFAHCVRAMIFFATWQALNWLLGQWGSHITLHSVPGLECLQTGQHQFGGRMSALESVRDRTDQSPGLWLAGCSEGVYVFRQKELSLLLSLQSIILCVRLLTQCSLIFDLIIRLCSQSGIIRKRNLVCFETSGAK